LQYAFIIPIEKTVAKTHHAPSFLLVIYLKTGEVETENQRFQAVSRRKLSRFSSKLSMYFHYVLRHWQIQENRWFIIKFGMKIISTYYIL